MKDQKKKEILLVCWFLFLGIIWLLNTDRYIKRNIINIDKADGVHLATEEKLVYYPFEEGLIKLVSYGGMVVKADNLFVGLFAPYSNQLTKIDINIRYTKIESTLATANVFQSNENPEEYILYMNNVYWSTHLKLIDLLKLIE